MKKLLQNGVVKATGKVLAMLGVSLTFAACYGPMPPEGFVPEEWDRPMVIAPEDTTGCGAVCEVQSAE